MSSRATSSWSRAPGRCGSRPLRVGIFGGAFNPPHLGHLICAQEAHSQLGLDVVRFVPVGRAPHRAIEHDAGVETRVRLCAEALAGDPRLELSRVEADRPGPSYTVDTLEILRQREPEHDLTVILGADQAARLPSWHGADRVLSLATVAVAAREGMERDAVLRALEGLAGMERVTFFDMPRVDVSSSLVRERVARGAPIRYLVPDRVARQVESERLYGATPVTAA